MSRKKIDCEASESDDDVTLEYTAVKYTTKKAVLLDVDGDDVWIPFSQAVYHNERDGELIVTRWIAEQKDLA